MAENCLLIFQLETLLKKIIHIIFKIYIDCVCVFFLNMIYNNSSKAFSSSEEIISVWEYFKFLSAILNIENVTSNQMGYDGFVDSSVMEPYQLNFPENESSISYLANLF